MNSRERVIAAINHRQPDRCPIDLGGCTQTGISASTLWRLKKALNMGDDAVRIAEISQMLGDVGEEVRRWAHSDVIGLFNRQGTYGYPMTGSKPWKLDDGTPVIMPEGFEYDCDKQGNKWLYPCSDRSAPYSGRMVKDGTFFDNIVHSPDFDMDQDEDELTPEEDFKDDFKVMSDEDARYYETESKRLFEETEYGIIGVLGGGGLGDPSNIPGPAIRHPKGIRKIEDWLMAQMLFPDYVTAIFRMQTDVMLKNLEIYRQAVGERIQVIWVSGTDFGTQHGLFLGKDIFESLYMPFYREINSWIHKNTPWKVFFHSCGAIYPLLEDMIDMGVDIINPLQFSAAGMDPLKIKEQYGDRLVFWGGGVDTQKVLPFGTPDEVERQVKDRIGILNKGGGYVFSTIHNIVAGVPSENLIRLYKAAWENG